MGVVKLAIISDFMRLNKGLTQVIPLAFGTLIHLTCLRLNIKPYHIRYR